jgi:hypothetical protein
MTRSTALILVLAMVAAASASAACGGGSSTPVTAPTGNLVTDTFTGTVQIAGQDFHPFTVTTGGTINATLVSAGPPPTITMGLGIGTPSTTGVCSLLSGAYGAYQPSTTAQLNGTLAAGTYCIEVFDVGNAAGPITYTVTVAHT